MAELVGNSAGLLGWTLKSAGPPKEKGCAYTWDPAAMNGEAPTVALVSKSTTQYCYDKLTPRGKRPRPSSDCAAAKNKCQEGTAWLFTKAARITKEKPVHVGSSGKAVIDFNSSKTAPLLQSTSFTQLVLIPEEDVATLLEAPNSERVEMMALP